MKLLDLSINGFGKFYNRSITFADGLNLVYGKNEAGKSTMHSFIRGMFFGMERQRGRAAKTDSFSRYKPWDTKGGYEGQLRLESGGHIYRIERNFQQPREFTLVDETLGKEIEPTKAFMDKLLGGLNETAYNNTVSIGQLKSATDSSMAAELRNYIANMNATGSMALNITKASDFLKAQKKELERQMMPEAARNYSSLQRDIRTIEQEISAPEYENHLTDYQKQKAEAKKEWEELQKEKEELLQKTARGHQVLENSQFTDETSIQEYEEHGKQVYQNYLSAKKRCEQKSQKRAALIICILGILSLGFGGYFLAHTLHNPHENSFLAYLPALVFFFLSLLLSTGSIWMFSKYGSIQKDMDYSQKLLQEIFSRHLGDNLVSSESMDVFLERMAEYKRLSRAVLTSDQMLVQLTKKMEQLQTQQSGFGEEIEKQQRLQWELEKKLEHLAACKTQAEALKDIIKENDRIAQEIAAIDLAQDTMTRLSTSIRDSFGLYLNKEASDLIYGITGGIYNSISVDEHLSVFMNTKTKLVPIEQVSSGTMDQVYLALRLASAKLMQKDKEAMPLIFDDSFALYDDERLHTALTYLSSAYSGQIIMFTCHKRESQVLTAAGIPYQLITI